MMNDTSTQTDLNQSIAQLRAYCAVKEHAVGPRVLDIERVLDHIENQAPFPPFHQMTPAQGEIVRHIWSQGIKFGRRSTPPRWVMFLVGLAAGVIWSLLVMQTMGVFTR